MGRMPALMQINGRCWQDIQPCFKYAPQMYQNAAILAAFLLIYSAFAGRVERSWISRPIVFTGIGFLFGADGLGALSIKINGGGQALHWVVRPARASDHRLWGSVLHEKQSGNDTIMLAAGSTVPLSVIAPGITANPLVKRMAASAR
jgi:hypothetical protein